MSKIKIGKTLTTSLGDTIVIEKNGKDAILYRKGEIENQYIYAHNIELGKESLLEFAEKSKKQKNIGYEHEL